MGCIVAFLFFIQSGESMIQHDPYDPNLFYDIYYTITELNQRQNHYLPLTINYFDIYF